MAKNQSSSPSKGEEGVCERLYRAVNRRSAFKSLRRGSPRPQQSSAAPEIAVAYNHGQEDNGAVTAVPKAKNPPPVVLHPRPRVQEQGAKEKRVSLVDDHHNHHHKPSEEKHAHHHHEAHFSDYITRVRARISRTLTHAGGGGGGEGGGNVRKAATIRRDSFNDKVSNYIHRARLSIRTTSNVGDHGEGKSSGGFKN